MIWLPLTNLIDFFALILRTLFTISFIQGPAALINIFDLIFLDPPFKEEKINILIEKIKEKKILKKNGILIIHRHKKDNLEITKRLNILDQRIYGISKITIGN